MTYQPSSALSHPPPLRPSQPPPKYQLLLFRALFASFTPSSFQITFLTKAGCDISCSSLSRSISLSLCLSLSSVAAFTSFIFYRPPL
ncbi:hypothetical protein BJ508DRAFT_7137 [Ascobolus immersus RN42]|uniref:Uncharacterized protein n=1 Tax=Ascobolus immersus RN42 TaxID=1160509 RepID=A0A3N4IGR2_ASCIM|nr:hypothetical protein BJ508DRAFT_7137 [Ascobolus immersus RN42]